MHTGLLFLLLLLAVASPARAQRLVSPEVAPDGRATFRLRAPGAREVLLRLEGLPPTAMQKDQSGVWSLTTSPLPPGIYVYTFLVDGLTITDPSNANLKYNLLNSESQVHVPGPPTLPWESGDVPRGVVHRHYYRSAVVGDERDFLVYTPPGYDPRAKTPYPTLYLLHGYSDDATAWTSAGLAHVILDNLIARGQARPMLVVMPLGYGTREIIANGWEGIRDPDVRRRSYDKFRESLLEEVIPQVEAAYHVSRQRDQRAIAGLSMGGTESLLVGLNDLDTFAWIGAFSSGGLGDNYAEQFPGLGAGVNARLRLLWIACGQQDMLLGSNQRLVDWLRSQGVALTWREIPGPHSFSVWRRHLAEFVPLLFQKKP
jgi:enterochelin esterase-like enzyme